MIVGHALSLEALDGAVAHGHSSFKLIKAEDDVHMVGENGSSSLAVRLGMSWITRRMRRRCMQ